MNKKPPSSEDITLRLPAVKFGQFDLVTDTVQVYYADDQLVILNKRHREKGPSLHPRLWADFRHLNVFDALLQANTSHASGVLMVQLADDVNKSVYLKNGEVIFAQSNLDDDRLGESLIRAGLLTQKNLDDAAKEISATRKLGKILIDHKLITPKELFAGVRHQVEEIIISLIRERKGRLAFYSGIASNDDVVALNLKTQRLLIQGLRQTAPWNTMDAGTSERAMYMSLANNPNHLGLNAEERRLVTLISGGISVKQLIDQCGFGLINTYRYLHQLLLRDVIALANIDPDQQPRNSKEKRKQIEKAIDSFNSGFAEMYQLLVAASSENEIQASMASFFGSMSSDIARVFSGISLQSGALDKEQLLANLDKLGDGDQRTILDEGLRELLNFTLFESHHLAPPDTVKQIVALIQKMELF